MATLSDSKKNVLRALASLGLALLEDRYPPSSQVTLWMLTDAHPEIKVAMELLPGDLESKEETDLHQATAAWRRLLDLDVRA